VLTGRPVEEILVSGGRAAAVRTAAGEVLHARMAVVSSAHLTQLPGMLRGIPVSADLVAAGSAWRPGLTLFAVHVAVRAFRFPWARRHGIGRRWAGIGERAGAAAGGVRPWRVLRRGPWLLIVCPSVVDPGRAPPTPAP
jgi:phytoene dehydrogenase-like protein